MNKKQKKIIMIKKEIIPFGVLKNSTKIKITRLQIIY